MIFFNNDYSTGCHPEVLQALCKTNMEQTAGYGTDPYCAYAAELIKDACENSDLNVHFLVGGTQTNMTVINAALRPHQGVISAATGHIHVHETGAVEATGHKVLALPSEDGKLRAEQIRSAVLSQRLDEAAEHIVQPKMVYISHPTELGTLYSLSELKEISSVCKSLGVYLFLDGARLGYGLTAAGADVTLRDLGELCDVFYIGGTKVGALFGEAVVISNPAIHEDFRYMIKQHGGMLAKGRLLGVQFAALFKNGLYFNIARQANDHADTIRSTLCELGYSFLVETTSNQIFPILPDSLLEKLKENFTFSQQERVSETARAVRFCTSWSTSAEQTAALCEELKRLSK